MEAINTGVAHDGRSQDHRDPVDIQHGGRIFRTLADTEINIDMVLQNISHVDRPHRHPVHPPAQRHAARPWPRGLQAEVGFAEVPHGARRQVSLVGAGMRNHPGVTAAFCEALSAVGVNARTSTSEIRISGAGDVDGAIRPCVVRTGRGRAGRRTRGERAVTSRSAMSLPGRRKLTMLRGSSTPAGVAWGEIRSHHAALGGAGAAGAEDHQALAPEVFDGVDILADRRRRVQRSVGAGRGRPGCGGGGQLGRVPDGRTCRS